MKKYLITGMGTIAVACLYIPLALVYLPQYWYIGLIGALSTGSILYVLSSVGERWLKNNRQHDNDRNELRTILLDITNQITANRKAYDESINSLLSTVQNATHQSAEGLEDMKSKLTEICKRSEEEKQKYYDSVTQFMSSFEPLFHAVNQDNLQTLKEIKECLQNTNSLSKQNSDDVINAIHSFKELVVDSSERQTSFIEKVQESHDDLHTVLQATAQISSDIAQKFDKQFDHQTEVLDDYKSSIKRTNTEICQSIHSVEDILDSTYKTIKRLEDTLNNFSDTVDCMSDINAQTNDYMKEMCKDKRIDEKEKSVLAEIERMCKKR